MRQKIGDGFKRNIKFNDDIKFPNQDEWMSVTPEIARDACREEDKRNAETVNGAGVIENLLSTVRNSASSGPAAQNNQRTNYLPPPR